MLVGKLVSGGFLHVDNPPGGSFDDVLRILVRPESSVAGFLWFIYVLAVYLLFVSVLFRIIGRGPMPLLLASLAVAWLPMPKLFMLDEVVWYLPFFSGGMVLWMYSESWRLLNALKAGMFVAIYVAALAAAIPMELPKWLVGALAFPAVIAGMQRLPMAWQAALGSIGRDSFAIYLINTIVIGITKGAMLRVLNSHGVHFLLYFPLLASAGVFAPIFIKRIVLAKLPWAARYL